MRNKPGRNEPSLEIHFGGKDLKPLHGFCAETNADLSDLCSVLESIKMKWQDYVFRMRTQHPVLNRFNVQQLKVISTSLAKAKRTSEPVEEIALYYMRSLNEKLIAVVPGHRQHPLEAFQFALLLVVHVKGESNRTFRLAETEQGTSVRGLSSPTA